MERDAYENFSRGEAKGVRLISILVQRTKTNAFLKDLLVQKTIDDICGQFLSSVCLDCVLIISDLINPTLAV